LAALVPPEALRLAAAVVLLSPYLPLLFMGEEYGERRPFLYFADHGDPALREAVREGRKAEFRDFDWDKVPPDPFSLETFAACRLDWGAMERPGHAELLAFYKYLLRLRREHPSLVRPDPSGVRVKMDESARTLAFERSGGGRRLLCLMNFSPEPREDVPWPEGPWRTLAASAPGGRFLEPWGLRIFERED
jgi:maltooligosyltrehalose trehalohydrolase